MKIKYSIPVIIFILHAFSAKTQHLSVNMPQNSVVSWVEKDPKWTLWEAAVQRLATDTSLRHGQASIVIMDVQSGNIIASHNPNMSVIPASNMKIVTTAAALGILGADFQFRTDLQYDGVIKDSILNGNLFIKGNGDPTLGSPLMDSIPSMDSVLTAFTLSIKQLGIKKINGKIVGDGSAFEAATAVQSWLWEDLGSYYGVGPSGLNFHENLYDLSFWQNSSSGGTAAIDTITPYVPNFHLLNDVKSVGNDDDTFIYSTPYATTGIVRGNIPTGNKKFSIQGALPDPPYFAAWHLRKRLIETGIQVTDSATTQLKLEQNNTPLLSRQTFFTWRSPHLSDIVKRTNTESINLYCEAMVRAIALQKTGIGSNEMGVREIVNYWRSKGVDTEGLFMQDGSGLSPRNGVTAMQLATILRLQTFDNQTFIHFFNSLPIPSKTGTLKNMFKNNPSVMTRLRAKSGTITRVKSYSGYVTTTDGRQLAFSAICNNFTCSQREIRRKLEQFMIEICQ